VADVDPTTLRFGPDEASPAHDLTDHWTHADHLQDRNLDGFMDLMMHFRTQESGIACGDLSATLTGNLFSGQAIEGMDTFRTVGCGRRGNPRVFREDEFQQSHKPARPADVSKVK
jgi:hypothetical protein